MINLERYWWPLATLAELNASQPLARTLHGIPLVLFHDAEGKPAALHDRCPHRHAPLSNGKVQHGQIACVPIMAGAFLLMATAPKCQACA